MSGSLKKKLFISLAIASAFAFFSCGKNKNAALQNIGDNGDFTVISFSPDEELPAEVKFPSIQIQFSQPVIALQKLGKPFSKSDIVTITPELSGTFRWYGTSLLSFESSDEVIPQKKYTVTIKNNTVDLQGKKITGQKKFVFHTAEMKITNIIPGYSAVKKNISIEDDDVPMEYASEVAVFFANRVNGKTVTKNLQVTLQKNDEKPHPVSYSWSAADDNTLILKLKSRLESDADITVTLPAGSIPDENCFPTSEEQTFTYHTLQNLIVKDNRTDDESGGKYSNPVRLIFNHKLDENSKNTIVKSITTEPVYKITNENVEISGAALIIYALPVTFNSKYTMKIASGAVKDIYGQSNTDDISLDITVPEAKSYANYKDWGFHILEAQFTPKLVFEHQNTLNGSYYSVEPIRGVINTITSAPGIKKDIPESEETKNKRIIESVDLCPYLEKTASGFRGTVFFNADMIYRAKTTDWKTQETSYKDFHNKNFQCIQVTDLGLSIRYAYDKALVLVTKLSTGAPVQGANVTAFTRKDNYSASEQSTDTEVILSSSDTDTVVTDADGLAILPYKPEYLSDNLYIRASTSDDTVVYAPDSWSNSVFSSSWDSGTAATARKDKTVTFMFTDRGLYKPGETVTFRGIDRTLSHGEYNAYTGNYIVQMTESAWRPMVYETITGHTSESGTFWGTWKIPETLVPGTYDIRYFRDGVSTTSSNYQSCSIQVQFFERLRFEAKASIPSVTYYSGDVLGADVKAQYLGGGNLTGSTYSSFWTREPVGFSPAGDKYKDMRFGPLQGYDGRSSLDTSDGILSGDGKAHLEQRTGDEKIKGMAYSYRAEVHITDSSNQMIAATARTIVHPAKFYTGISSIKNISGFPKKGDTLKFNYLFIKPDGTVPLYSDFGKDKKMKVELLRENWKEIQQIGYNGEINTRYEREMISDETSTEDLKNDGEEHELSIKPKHGGAYLLRLTAKDNRGADVVTERRFYVTSSDWNWFNRDDAQEITMQADRTIYKAGDTAHVLAQSALPKGRYLMTIEREGIISQKVFTLNESSTVIDIPVESAYLPVVYVTLTSYSVRNGMPKNNYSTPDLDKPKGYFGYTALHVDPSPKEFIVEVKTDKLNYRPGEEASITLHASKNGQSLPNAEITLMAVDRGVIDLINYHVQDPIAFFYDEGLFPDCVKGGDSRSILIDPVTYEIRNLFGGDSDGNDSSKIQERKNFNPTALFLPELITDKNGNAVAKFKLPDTLTAYRITAVGVDKNDFALTESELPVNNPVSVREVLPRQLRVNDTGETGVTITNMQNKNTSVKIGLQVYCGLDKTGYIPHEDEIIKTAGTATVNGAAEKQVTVPAGQTIPLMFSIKAETEGWITLEFTVTSDSVNERIYKALQIEHPYIYETVTTVGEVRSSKESDSAKSEEKIILPDAENGKGSLFIQLDATRLGTLHDAVNYVFRYPYGCLEQRSSCILPLVAFGKYMETFSLESEVKNPESVAKAEIDKWAKYQLTDGGFPYWPDGNHSDFAVSLRIAEILSIAQEKGISISDAIDTDALKTYIGNEIAYLKNTKQSDKQEMFPVAYGYYVMEKLGSSVTDSDLNNILKNDYSGISEYALAGLTWLDKGNSHKAAECAKKIKRFMSLSTRGCDITQKNSSCWYYYNNKAEQYALALQLFTQIDNEDTYNRNIVYELLQIQKAGNGYWQNTAITSRVLTALDVYIRSNNLTETNFTAQALIGGIKFIKGEFKGAGAKPVEKTESFTEGTTAKLPHNKELPLSVSKDGKGVLYYTVSMKYAIPASEQYARDEGICIYSIITDVKTGKEVTGNELQSGTIYREELYISSTKDRTFVAVRAPIPCGAEIMNAAFVSTGTLPPTQKKNTQDEDEADNDEDYNYGLSHQDIYDSEVRYFWNQFSKGHQKVEFLFRTARIGTYGTPSATAECMYEPEIFGRTAGKNWTIKDND